MIWKQIVTDKDLLKLHQDANGSTYIGVTKNGKMYIWQDRPVNLSLDAVKQLFAENGLGLEIFEAVVNTKGLFVLPKPEPKPEPVVVPASEPEPEPEPAVAEVPASPTLEEVKRDLDDLKREFDAWVQETTKAIHELNEKIL